MNGNMISPGLLAFSDWLTGKYRFFIRRRGMFPALVYLLHGYGRRGWDTIHHVSLNPLNRWSLSMSLSAHISMINSEFEIRNRLYKQIQNSKVQNSKQTTFDSAGIVFQFGHSEFVWNRAISDFVLRTYSSNLTRQVNNAMKPRGVWTFLKLIQVRNRRCKFPTPTPDCTDRVGGWHRLPLIWDFTTFFHRLQATVCRHEQLTRQKNTNQPACCRSLFARPVGHLMQRASSQLFNVCLRRLSESQGTAPPGLPITLRVEMPVIKQEIPRAVQNGSGSMPTPPGPPVTFRVEMPVITPYVPSVPFPGPAQHASTGFIHRTHRIGPGEEPTAKTLHHTATTNIASVYKHTETTKTNTSISTTGKTPGIDIRQLTDRVYRQLERRLKLEKERRGW